MTILNVFFLFLRFNRTIGNVSHSKETATNEANVLFVHFRDIILRSAGLWLGVQVV